MWYNRGIMIKVVTNKIRHIILNKLFFCLVNRKNNVNIGMNNKDEINIMECKWN